MIPNDFLASFTLPTLPNHTVRDITERAPWEGESTALPLGYKKTAARAFHVDPGTQHLYYSGYEAENPTVRLSKENSPRLMRALLVDYDCYSLSDETLEATLDSVPSALAPAFVSRSPSRGVHAMWLLEEPIWVASNDLRKRLLGWFKRQLKLAQLLPGMDEKVYNDAMLYFACGRNWQALESQLINKATIARALLECGTQATFKGNGVVVPLDIVAAEVEARFPGRWQGDFTENARGCRFWDDSGDAQSAIVKNEGMLCYTGDKGFLDWASIFGRGFVEKFIDDKIGGSLDGRYFDGTDYWIFSEGTKMWRKISRDDLSRKLRVQGLSGVSERGMTFSLVDKTLDAIAEQNLVASAAPFVQRRTGIVVVDGQRHLNISNVRPIEPVDGEAWADDFPWIQNFLANSFVQVKDGHGQQLMDFATDPDEQLWRFLAWLQRAYKAGIEYEPCQGHVLVLAGEPGCGKTLLADVLIGKALGGKVDASRFILGETHFNKKMFHVACWTVNDASASTDPQRKARYNSLVKQVAANRDFSHEAKGRDAVDVAWMGRLAITCNVDPESLQMMPSMDSSMADKVLALRVWGGDGDDEDENRKQMEEVKWFGLWNGRKPDENITHELPFFLRWLLTWEAPAYIERDPRFGYRSYAHPALREHAESVGQFAPFSEILSAFLTVFFLSKPEEIEWRGTATDLLEVLNGDLSPVKSVAKEFNSYKIGRGLASLTNRAGHKCRKNIKDGRSIYTFPRDKWLK